MPILYKHDFSNCMQGQIDCSGTSPSAINDALRKLADCDVMSPGWSPITRLPSRRDDIEIIESTAARLRKYERVLVLGTGGSSLGARALTAIAPQDEASRLIFLDNLDPNETALHLSPEALNNAAIIAISKSGTTLETLTTLSIALENLTGRDPLSERFVAITRPGKSPLRDIAELHGAQVIDHDINLPGRFSVLSAVGLLPAAVAGIRPVAVRVGAASVLQRSRQLDDQAAAVGAAITTIFGPSREISMQVLMPYIDRLNILSLWHRQLWAESLGKSGKGTTPVPALGPVDQHSQLQLYLDGPRDKLFTIITSDCEGQGPKLGAVHHWAKASPVEDKTVGDIVAAQQRATIDTLVAARRPVRELRIERLDERVIGALLMHFMLETMFAAMILEVDPFNQPAVEDSKRRTWEILESNKATQWPLRSHRIAGI
jgi:glucose-6-phosphate isomerase